MAWTFTFFTITGFLSGSILYSALLPRLLRRVDIVEESDDHNPGTANVFKLSGPGLGVVCLLLDMAKGFLPVLLALGRVNPYRISFALIMAAPVLGHAFSPLMKGHGGKSIAVSFGVLLALCFRTAMVWYLAAAFLFFSLVLVIQPHSCRVIVSFSCYSLFSLLVVPFHSFVAGGLLISAVVIAKHLSPREFSPSHFQVSLFGRRKRLPKHVS
ncbi:glycerol-3-phosphate acyltransferase [Zongyangia hominis]|uniref:Glycerol-3-phosphate acyltransferase n=1 Tax=Zongyangia hominis TaxID=2763677 RepID=A0A926ICD7_9FIRM|nr:glycerol-3-phosphate acyltransferase [Zongyangia hominis]MBC8571112.1 glycerol-3-phosphate acyltransferase [Zongyangia hominis]